VQPYSARLHVAAPHPGERVGAPDRIEVLGQGAASAGSNEQLCATWRGVSGSVTRRRGAGGGEGMGAIEATLDAIAAACGGACQVVAICGRNKKLARRLQGRWAAAPARPLASMKGACAV